MVETPIVVDIWLDLLSAQSYLSLVAFRTALSNSPHSADFAVVLHPYFGAEEGRGAPAAVDAPSSLYGAAETEMAEQLGIVLSSQVELPATSRTAQKLVNYIRGVDEDAGDLTGAETESIRVALGVMRSLWEVGADIASPETLIAVGQDFGHGGAELARALNDDLLEAAVDEEFSLALHLGVQAVPLFLFDEQLVVEGMHSVDAYERILDTAWKTRKGEGAEPTLAADADEGAAPSRS